MKSDITYRSNLRFILEGIEGLLFFPVIFISWPLSRLWLSNWGATTEECLKEWPGDIQTSFSVNTYTRAIDIHASSENVWAWVVQLGLGRAGFYSYELLERMVGIPVKNVESILPDCQSIELGSKIKLHPNAEGMRVGALLEGRYICFGKLDRQTDKSSKMQRTWSIYVEYTTSNTSRLIVRSCIEVTQKPSMGRKLALEVEASIDFLMEQRMLRTIRRLSENMTRPF